MPETIRIENVPDYVGQTVTLQGWLYAKTGKGKLQFLQIRDGSGFIQGVMFRPNLSPEIFEAGKRLTQESSIMVTGLVKADERAKGIPAGFELEVTDLQTAQLAEEYPITPKEHGIDFFDGSPPPVASLPATVGHFAGARQGDAGYPRVAGFARLSGDVYPHLHPGCRRRDDDPL